MACITSDASDSLHLNTRFLHWFVENIRLRQGLEYSLDLLSSSHEILLEHVFLTAKIVVLLLSTQRKRTKNVRRGLLDSHAF